MVDLTKINKRRKLIETIARETVTVVGLLKRVLDDVSALVQEIAKEVSDQEKLKAMVDEKKKILATMQKGGKGWRDGKKKGEGGHADAYANFRDNLKKYEDTLEEESKNLRNEERREKREVFQLKQEYIEITTTQQTIAEFYTEFEGYMANPRSIDFADMKKKIDECIRHAKNMAHHQGYESMLNNKKNKFADHVSKCEKQREALQEYLG